MKVAFFCLCTNDVDWFQIREGYLRRDISTHLSKGPIDLKQSGTQIKTPFSGTVFMPFVVVWFCSIAFGTIKWKLFIGWWKRPIRTDQPHARAQNIARKWFLRSILFKLKYILKDFSNQYRTPGWPLLSLILYFCSWFRTKDTVETRWLLKLMQCWFLLILWPKETVNRFLVFRFVPLSLS